MSTLFLEFLSCYFQILASFVKKKLWTNSLKTTHAWSPWNCRSLDQSLKAVTMTTTKMARRMASPSSHSVWVPLSRHTAPHCKSGGSTIESYFTKMVFYTVDYDFCICYHTIQYSLMAGAYFSLIC